ncbi:hypothetical protein PybrP1_001144 [[Pythium] brassicae (nom. inval.)]|nr:hypothetical protein PybrP1_001144 [[Pythium] brassicae (nom. inval.)]
MTPGCDREEARVLLSQLTEFATAPGALEALFTGFETDASRARVLRQLLAWQSPAQAARAVHDVVAAFDADDCEGEEALAGAGGLLLLVMGKPALLFATSLYDEELALLVWRGLTRFARQVTTGALDLARQALDTAFDSHGFCALHYAVEAHMPALLEAVARDLLPDASRVAQLSRRATTQDVALPVGRNQVRGRDVASGGCTLLHLAARKGERALTELLVAPPFSLASVLTSGDWDGSTPLRLARLHGRDDVAAFLLALDASPDAQAGSEDPDALAALRLERDAHARDRYVASLDAPPAMQQAFTFPGVWSARECAHVLAVLDRVTRAHGWCTQRHAAHPTTDMPCHRVVPIESWVRGSLAARLFPLLHARYAIPRASKQIAFRELFYVKYEARRGERAELGVHCDGSVLSFNVLLNPASEFAGGGTFFEATGETVRIAQGDAVAHSGKVRHAGAPVLDGRRLLLVGFLDIVDRVFGRVGDLEAA